MICEECGRDRLLTYRSTELHKRSVCADCIRAHHPDTMAAVPDSLAEAEPVIELGGAIGRRASVACKQGQHDLCPEDECDCRCHETP